MGRLKSFLGKITSRSVALIVAAAMLIAMCTYPAEAQAEEQTAFGINVNMPTRQEIAQRLNGLQNLTTAYKDQPLLTEPYSAGTLTDETLQNALDWMNAVRFVAGIPDNVVLDDSYNSYAQASSIVNFANDVLSHYPEMPSGMSSALYELGKTGSSQSNIACGWGSFYKNGASFRDIILDSWMADDDAGNIRVVGHRRWILNPSMEKTGFGCVWGEGGRYGGRYFSAVYAFDNSFGSTDYYGVAWPAHNMPVNMFSYNYPWSISMGTQVSYDTTVTLTRIGDGKTWNFSNGSSDFFIENGNYGKPGCIIFRPDGISSYAAGDTFKVVVRGTGLDVQYYVNFFDPANVSGNPVNPDSTTTPSPEPTATTAPAATATPSPIATTAPDPTGTQMESIKTMDLSFVDVRTGNTVTIDGDDGTPKVILLGGIGSCGVTCNAIKTLSSIISEERGACQYYALDIQYNSSDSIKNWMNNNGIDASVYAASNADSIFFWLIDKGGATAGIGYGSTISMPIVFYVKGNGDIVAGTTGSQSRSEIEENLSKILEAGQPTSAPVPTTEPTSTPVPTATAVPSSAENPSVTPTAVPTTNPDISSYPTDGPIVTATPTTAPNPVVTDSPTATPKPTATPSPTATPKPTTIIPTPTATPVPDSDDSRIINHETYTQQTRNYTQVIELETDSDNNTSITVSKEMKNGTGFEALYEKTSSKKIKLVDITTTDKAFTIPTYVKVGKVKYYITAIGSYAVNEGSLESITIGSKVKTIKKNAFRNQKKLGIIEITAKNLKSVGKYAFKNIAKNAVFKIKGSKKDFDRVKKLIQKSGVGKGVTFERIS